MVGGPVGSMRCWGIVHWPISCGLSVAACGGDNANHCRLICVMFQRCIRRRGSADYLSSTVRQGRTYHRAVSVRASMLVTP